MNTNFLNTVTNFIKKRTFELLGLILILTGIALAITFVTYSPEDPSFIYGKTNIEIKNFFGIYGCSIADFLLQSFGLVSFLLLLLSCLLFCCSSGMLQDAIPDRIVSFLAREGTSKPPLAPQVVPQWILSLTVHHFEAAP